MCVVEFPYKQNIIYSVHVGNMTMLFQVLIIEMFLTKTELDICEHCIPPKNTGMLTLRKLRLL